ncbi:MAG: heavy metal-binding domain-containing protein [Planctomycetia bacterium]|nr:heavy metal-binding domain-containing protein [Planctomycetia bacterium]
MVTSGLDLPGFRITKCFGIVRGLIVRSPGFAGGISAAFQAMGGGTVQTMVEVCERARHDAFLLMVQHAVQFGANAVIAFRYDTTEIAQQMTEVLAYGTAVWAEPV